VNEFETALAAYQAAGRGNQVDGSFYDVWQTDADAFQVRAATASKVAD